MMKHQLNGIDWWLILAVVAERDDNEETRVLYVTTIQ